MNIAVIDVGLLLQSSIYYCKNVIHKWKHLLSVLHLASLVSRRSPSRYIHLYSKRLLVQPVIFSIGRFSSFFSFGSAKRDVDAKPVRLLPKCPIILSRRFKVELSIHRHVPNVALLRVYRIKSPASVTRDCWFRSCETLFFA